MNNYREVPNRVSKADQQKYGLGIARVAALVEELHSQGLLPERFSPEPYRLHPSLEGKVSIEPITIGGKSAKELLRSLGRKRINIGSYAKSMIESAEFSTLPEEEQREIAIGSVRDIVPNPKGPHAITEEIWAARDEKGLEAVPAESALQYLLQYGDKLQLGDVIWFSMKAIADCYGYPNVFGVWRGDDGLWLNGRWAKPSDYWFSGQSFVFGVPQVNKA